MLSTSSERCFMFVPLSVLFLAHAVLLAPTPSGLKASITLKDPSNPSAKSTEISQGLEFYIAIGVKCSVSDAKALVAKRITFKQNDGDMFVLDVVESNLFRVSSVVTADGSNKITLAATNSVSNPSVHIETEKGDLDVKDVPIIVMSAKSSQEKKVELRFN